MTLLKLNNVGLFYKRKGLFSKKQGDTFWALNSVSLSINRGETLGVVGRNGAGKSTLLQILAGIIEPDKGTIERQPCRITLLSLQVGFLPHITGRENIMLSGLLLGITRDKIKSKIPEIIVFSELEDFIDQPIQTYSTGMKARLGFSIAVFGEPDILLIDEVLGVGDSDFRLKSTEKMKEIIKSNATVVLVSHNPSTISSLCDRAIWIEYGNSVIEGPVDKVLSSYLDSNKTGMFRKPDVPVTR